MKKGILEKMYAGNVELSDVKVELANMDEYNRSVFGDETWIEQLNDFVTKSNDIIKQLQMRVEGGLFVGKEAKKAIDKTIAMESSIEKAVKDLGIDMPADITTSLKNAVAEDSDLFELRKSIEKYELQYLDLTSDF